MAIEFTDYDRITDTLMYLGDNIFLEFSTALSKKTKLGERAFFHYETVYDSDKYGREVRSIKRNMNFYFAINVKTDFAESIILRFSDVEYVCRLINNRVIPWFLGSQEQLAYYEIDNEDQKVDIAIKDYVPVVYYQDQKSLTFEPCVMYDTYDRAYRAIKTTISNKYSFELSVDKFMEFYCILSKTDMYTAACSLVDYAKTQPYNISQYNAKAGLGTPIVNRVNDEWYKKSFSDNAFLTSAPNKNG